MWSNSSFSQGKYSFETYEKFTVLFYTFFCRIFFIICKLLLVLVTLDYQNEGRYVLVVNLNRWYGWIVKLKISYIFKGKQSLKNKQIISMDFFMDTEVLMSFTDRHHLHIYVFASIKGWGEMLIVDLLFFCCKYISESTKIALLISKITKFSKL